MTGQNFSISLKNFEKIFFAWNVLKHKVNPKKLKNFNFFFKIKIPPLPKDSKNLNFFNFNQVQDSCKISCVLQEFLAQAKFLQEACHSITTSYPQKIVMEWRKSKSSQ